MQWQQIDVLGFFNSVTVAVPRRKEQEMLLFLKSQNFYTTSLR